MKLKSVVLLALMCVSVCAVGQNVRYSAPFPSVSSIDPPYLIANLPPNSPVLAVCHSPANALPCTNYATTFTSLGVACLNGAQDTPDPNPSACQSTGDSQGNIAFWAPSGTYDYTVCVQNHCFGPYTITLGGSGGGGGSVSITATAPAVVTPSPLTTTGVISINNATVVTVGAVQLAGDLCGLATAPTVCNGSNITNGSIQNSGLLHPSLTVNAGTGLTGGGVITLGSSATLNLASQITAGSCTNCSLNYNAQGQITVATNGSAGGVSGIGTTGFVPIWTSSSSLGNSLIQGTGLTVNIGTGPNPLLVGMGVNSQPTCSSGTPPPLAVISCWGEQIQFIEHSGSSTSAITADLYVVDPGGSGQGALGMGGYFTVTDGLAAKEIRTIDAEAIGSSGSRTAPRTGIWAFSQAGVTAGTEALNQAIYAQSSAAGGGHTVTNDYTVHVDSPTFVGGTMTNHVGLQIEDQAVGGVLNPNPFSIRTIGTAPVILGGPLTVAGVTTLSNLSSGGTQCVQVSSTGILSGTGLACGGGGGGPSITVNGGAALGSPVNFQNGSAVTGIIINASNPSSNNVAFAISGTLTNAGLANSSVTVTGTANQITSTGGSPLSLGGTVTLSLPTGLVFPGKWIGAASTISNSTFNIPSGVAPTSPVSGDVWNASGIVKFFDSVNTNSFVTIQTALVNNHVPAASGTNGLLHDGYAVQGTDTSLITSGTISGTSVLVCTDANGGLTTSSCPTVGSGLSGMVANGLAIAATPSTITSSLNSNVTGQIPTFQNGGPPIATSPSLTDSVNSPVTSAGYTLACDSGTAIIDRAHMIRFQSPASGPIIPLSTATGCTGGFVASLINESAGTLVFSRSGSDTFSVYNGTTASLAQTTFTLTNGQYATLNQGATGIWEVLVKTNSGLPSGTQGYFLTNTTGANSYGTTLTLGVDLAQFAASGPGGAIPFTTGTTTPTADVTGPFNALLATLPVGSRIVFPPNSHYKFAPTAGAQYAVPVQKNGFVFACGGGPGPQYSAALVAAECSVHMATPGGYVFGTGHYGNSNLPTSGPQFVNLTFVDDTAKSNAGGQIYMADVNDVLGDNLTAIGGWRQPAVAPPSAPTCTASNAGGTIGAGAVAVELEAWTTSGPTLPSAATTCASSPIAGTTGSVSIVIPSPVAPIIGYEALCKVAGSSTFRTCSPAPTYTVNGDGSETINLQSATPLVVTAAPAAGARQAVPIDLSHTGGISINGSINWAGLAGFSNGPRFKNLKSYFVQGAWTCGIGGASCNLSESELMACDVVTASGACGAGNATPGLVVGLTGLRLRDVHVTGSTSSPSTGIVAALSGFNNVIMGGTFQSNTGASTEIGISMINTTGTVIKGIVLANYGSCIIADSNSSNNQADFADNGSCNGGGGASPYTDNGTGNQWLRTGKTFVLSASTTGGSTINIPHGVAPSAPVNGDEWTTTSGKFDRINGTSITMAAAGTAGTASTTCTNQFFTVISATAAPTCTSMTLASAQFANQGTTTTVLHGNAAGNPSFGSIVAADITNNTITGTQLAASLALVNPNIGAATGTSLLVTGNVDGTAPVTITTGTTANLGTTFKSGYTFNQEATAGTAVTYTLPATAVGLQYCVRNSIVSGTGAADTGVLTVYPPASSFVILNGVRNTVGGGGTHGVASGGAAGDSACFVAIDATDWEIYVIRGTWSLN